MAYFYLIIAIIAEVTATAALKYSEGFTKLMPSILVVVGYGMAFYFLSLVLKTIAVGVAYAIWAGLGIVFLTIIGVLFFEQKLDFAAMLGMFLIISGVIVINVFSKSVER